MVGGQGPFAATVREQLLEADLGLLRVGQVHLLLGRVEGDQVAHTVFAGGVLAVQRQFRGQREDQPGAPVAALQAAVAAGAGEQVVAVDMVLVAAHPGHQRQALVELQAVLGEQGEGAGLAARVRPVGRAAFEVAGRGMPGVDVVAADIGIGRYVVGQAEADAVVLGADQGAAVEAEQGVLEGEGLAVADLLLLVADAQVVLAQQLFARDVPFVGFGVAPVAAGLDVVQLVARGDAVGKAPVAGQAGPLVVVALHVIAHVVVLLAQALVVLAADQRGAEVVHRLLVAIVVGEGEGQIVAGLPAQRRADAQVARVATVDPAVALLLVQVEPVAEAVGQRAAAVQGQLAVVVGAVAEAQVVADLAGERLLRHHVDHRAGGAFAVQHRGRAADHVDALDHPRIAGEVHRAHAGVQARAVEQLHHRCMAAEAARREAGTAISGGADEADAGAAGNGGLDAGVVASANFLAADAAGARRGVQGAEAQARTGTDRSGEVDVVEFGGILANADQLAGQGEGGFLGFGEGGRYQQQAGGEAEGERLGAQTAEAGHGRSIS
ncbi:hypothetical protein PAERUG_P48_London_17_VIM_2_01_13_03830 [Pseudomonas aeruginosa]|nr:hypothetical protein PAERUG_P48_London_17_VIM_2_01_13_03830 [Pseudomonas aeruginosa]